MGRDRQKNELERARVLIVLVVSAPSAGVLHHFYISLVCMGLFS